MTLCAVSWCAAYAVDGLYCVVHARNPDYVPARVEPWAPDWEHVHQQVLCEACDGKGTVECHECGHESDCDECDGTGARVHEILRHVETGEELSVAEWEARRAREPGGWLFLPQK